MSAPPPSRDAAARAAVIAFACLFAATWLIAENHSIYGDEAAHLENLQKVFGSLTGGLLHRTWQLYLFDARYPPLFYLVSSPFVLAAADPVFGARLFVAAFSVLLAYVAYRVFRLFADPGVALAGIALLYANGMFIEATRYYLLEIALSFWILLTTALAAQYSRTRRPALLVGIGLMLSVGLLTKFNFLLYVAPLLLPVLYDRIRSAQWAERRAAARDLALTLAPLLAVAGPWYFVRFGDPHSAALGLKVLQESGNLPIPRGFSEFIGMTTHVYSSWFSPVLLLCGGLAVMSYPVCLVWSNYRSPSDPDLSRLRQPVLIGAFISILVIPTALAWLGLGTAARWHLEYLYVIVLIVAGVSVIRARLARSLITAGILLAASIQVLAWVVPVGHWGRFFVAAASGFLPRPSSVDVGAKTVAQRIAAHDETRVRADDRRLVLFLTHEHRGMHSSAVQHYLDPAAARFFTKVAMFFDRPIDLRNYFDARYLVVASPQESLVRIGAPRESDRELRRNLALWEQMPESYRSELDRVADVRGRYGRYTIFFVRPTVRQEAIIRDLVNAAKKADPRPYAELQLDAQALVFASRVPGADSRKATMQGTAREILDRRRVLAEPLSALNAAELERFIADVRVIAGSP